MIPSPGAFLAGVVIFFVVVWDAFEVVVLPRRVTRKFRLTRLFYRTTWTLWRMVVRLVPAKKSREALLGFYGPISLPLLLVVWAFGLVVSFALLHYGAGSAVDGRGMPPSFAVDLYLSGTTFFTLGLGDVTPHSSLARVLTVIESGVGFGFLAIIISYLPVVYQSFARRELAITLLDARAGSPPSAGELLRRHSYPHGLDALCALLKELERWCAELMESHLSYPVLAYFRSQHDNQSWIASLTVILDTCALLRVNFEGACVRQAELTFAIARHAVVDLSQVFGTPPHLPPQDRLSTEDFARLHETLAQSGLQLRGGESVYAQLAELRRMYEPYVFALASHVRLALPPWFPEKIRRDNWQTTAWAETAGVLKREEPASVHDDHFD